MIVTHKRKGTIVVLLLLLLISSLPLMCYAERVIVNNSALRTAEEERPAMVKTMQHYFNTTIELQGDSDFVNLDDFLNSKKEPFGQGSDEGPCKGALIKGILVTACPLTGHFGVENQLLNEKMYGHEITSNEFPKDNELIWKEAERILHLYYSNPDITFKRFRMIEPGAITKTLSWEVYYDGYRVIPGGASLRYFYKQGVDRLDISIGHMRKIKVNVSKKEAEEKAYRKAKHYFLTQPTLRPWIKSNKPILLSPMLIKDEKQPIFINARDNYWHRLVYQIEFRYFDKSYDIEKNKDSKDFYNNEKGVAFLDVDAETGRVYKDYGEIH